VGVGEHALVERNPTRAHTSCNRIMHANVSIHLGHAAAGTR